MNRLTGAIATLVLVCLQPSLAVASICDGLQHVTLAGAAVTGVQSIAAGAFAPPELAAAAPQTRQQLAGLPAFCRVMISARPSIDSDIRIEVWLPQAGWNGRFQAVGDGGLAGVIPMSVMAEALVEGYATSGTDTGHVGGNADFMPGHPEKLVDFAYRSTHEMAVAAKAVIAAFYGKAPAWSYYNACSGGGRHGITSAQRYPGDFDGIVAGAPSWNQARLDAGRIGVNLFVNRAPGSRIPENKFPMIHAAVILACDGLDGAQDGLIENPRACPFDYGSLLCKGEDGPSCLTAPQVESAKAMTSPFRESKSGRVLLQPHLHPGSELWWATLGSPEPLPNSLARVRNFHLKDTQHAFRLDTIAQDIERAAKMDKGLLASDNFNLKPFFERGGKLLLWHGWADPQVPAENTLIYHDNVVSVVGETAKSSMALFMMPGVLHCRGGPGPDAFDRMGAISKWVEQNEKPVRIVATRHSGGKVQRTRPLCPFPQVARYQGTGDMNDESNFVCVLGTAGAATR